jgi:hypothetical protein
MTPSGTPSGSAPPSEITAAASAGSIVIAALELARDTLLSAPEFTGRMAVARVLVAALAYASRAPARRPALIEIDGRTYLWRDIAALRRQQLAEPVRLADAHTAPAGDPAVASLEPPRLYRWRIQYHQTSVREIIIDGHDAEEAVCRANIDLFTPRDTSELVCAHLGRWTAKREVD